MIEQQARTGTIKKLERKATLITGAARGTGAAIAEQLAGRPGIRPD
jgi:NAD(P)-dependent dehydrogenase (short-subunit alcohol dehydrogenase family)